MRLVVVRLGQFHINNESRDSPKPAQTLKLNSNLTLRGNLHVKWTPQPDLPGLTFEIQLSRLKTWKDINGIFSQLTKNKSCKGKHNVETPNITFLKFLFLISTHLAIHWLLSVDRLNSSGLEINHGVLIPKVCPKYKQYLS